MNRKFNKLYILFGLVLLLATVCGADSDDLLQSLKPRGAVNDFADVLDPAYENRISAVSTELQQKTGAAIVVVTIKSLQGGDIDDFTNRLFERWGIGEKGKDNGLLLLAAMEDQLLRIEVGYGLEGVVPDSFAGRVRRNVINPSFKKKEYGKGFLNGVSVLAQRTAGKEDVELTGTPQGSQRVARKLDKDEEGGIISKIFNLILIVAFIAFAIRHPFLAMLLLSGGRGGRGGFGGGFGGGGFGGFGGGISGGAGSSGGW